MHIEQNLPGQYRRFQREFVYLPEVLRAQFTLEFDVRIAGDLVLTDRPRHLMKVYYAVLIEWRV